MYFSLNNEYSLAKSITSEVLFLAYRKITAKISDLLPSQTNNLTLLKFDIEISSTFFSQNQQFDSNSINSIMIPLRKMLKTRV